MTPEPRPIVQSLWVGERLSSLEQLAISSFLANGHEYHLHVYDELSNVPSGARQVDAAAILPSEWRFRDSRSTFSGFSNFFRYKLLLEKGGWWVDTDIVCLRPFEFRQELVLMAEADGNIGSAVIRVPPHSALMTRLWNACSALNRTSIEWGHTGPDLLCRVVHELGLTGAVVSPGVFCPIDWRQWATVLDPALNWEPDPETRAVHLWNEMWRLGGADKDQRYPADCLYERLKTAFLDDASRLRGLP